MDEPIFTTTVTVPPTVEPIGLGETKDFLDIERDDSDEDVLLPVLIKAARVKAEEYIGIKLMSQTLKTYFGDWPSRDDYIVLEGWPLISVTTVKYTSSSGNQSTLSADNYDVDTDSEPGRVVLKYSQTWPTTNLQPANPIEVEYVAGFGIKRRKVPEDIRMAMMMLVEEYFEERGAAKELPAAVKVIFDSHRLIFI